MAQIQSMRCYHHSNCEDRPAVSRCKKCGKGLCRECTDNLKSEDTGEILCVDCLNKEMIDDVNWAIRKRNEVRTEMIFIVVGFIIGLAIEIFLGIMANGASDDIWNALFAVSFLFFMPTLLASFRTIIHKVGDTFDNFILRIIFFFILCVISPIIFIWRLVKRGRDIKRLKRFAILQIMKHEANQEYANIAAKMTTRLTTEEFERNLVVKYAALYKSDKEAAEKKIAEERAKFEAVQKEKEVLEKDLKAAARRSIESDEEMKKLKSGIDESNKKAKLNAKKAKAGNRINEDVDR